MGGKPLESLVFTNENCIGCNKCISVCSSTGACVSKKIDGENHIHVDPNRCIGCGACIDVCEHNAREYNDDTIRFFDDLKAGKSITVLIAPAFKANYPNSYKNILGGLKNLGVKHFINVSFGADITTWAYINYVQNNKFYGGISQPCPAVVGYIERHIPELIPKLFPIQSPLICSAIYARNEMGITDDFAFISPCIAKKLEIDDPNTKGMVKYNVTFEHLMHYIDKFNAYGELTDDEIEYGLGAIYPMPGGLKENVQWFLGNDVFVRQMDGEKRMYKYLESNKDDLIESKTPYMMVDALNCSTGCIYGTGCEIDKSSDDSVYYNLVNIRNDVKNNQLNEDKLKTPEQRLAMLNEHFKNLNLDDYKRNYTDLSKECQYSIPTFEEENAIFNDMNKFTIKDRTINCSRCGYDSCRQMVMAIHNGFNTKDNCMYYVRHEAEDYSQKLNASEAENNAKKVFLANMSHEIRTPINGILGMNDAILRESTDENILEYAKNVESAGKVLLSIINDVLDISKIEAGKMEIDEDEYFIADILKDVCEINRPIISKKGINFIYKGAQNLPKKLYGDCVRIRQIIMNLISNAVKYTKEGSITLGVEWNMKEDSDVGELIAYVGDTGVGIKKEDIGGLFESFRRLDSKNNKYVQGTGLGLPISKTFANLMGGDIYVESIYGVGSKFTLRIPQRCINENDTEDLSAEDASANETINSDEFTASKARILAVDDIEMNLKVIVAMLKGKQITVDKALSGLEALELSKKNRYDIILMDHMMPEMNGVETLINLKNQENGLNKETPVIVVTANAVRGVEDEYKQDGFDDYLFKPIARPELMNIILKYLPKDLID